MDAAFEAAEIKHSMLLLDEPPCSPPQCDLEVACMLATSTQVIGAAVIRRFGDSLSIINESQSLHIGCNDVSFATLVHGKGSQTAWTIELDLDLDLAEGQVGEEEESLSRLLIYNLNRKNAESIAEGLLAPVSYRADVEHDTAGAEQDYQRYLTGPSFPLSPAQEADMDFLLMSDDMERAMYEAEKKSMGGALATVVPSAVGSESQSKGGWRSSITVKQKEGSAESSQNRNERPRRVNPGGFYSQVSPLPNDDAQTTAETSVEERNRGAKRQRSLESWDAVRGRLRRLNSSSYAIASRQTKKYRSFPRQTLAFQEAKEFHENLTTTNEIRVWSYEGFSSGKRQFLAADWSSFLHKYW